MFLNLFSYRLTSTEHNWRLLRERRSLNRGEYFKPKDGDDKIRVLYPTIPYQSEFKGKVRVQFVCWVIDRSDAKIKLYFMPASILDAIAAFQRDEDYSFEEVPMPYYINIKTEGPAGGSTLIFCGRQDPVERAMFLTAFRSASLTAI